MSGCAAKLERTGFVLRNVWPGVKQFGIEQSASFAQSANESGFVRKNSRNVEVAAASAGSSHCSRSSSLIPRGPRAAPSAPAVRLAARRLAPETLGGAAFRPRTRHLSSVGACPEPKPLKPSLAALLPNRQAEPLHKGQECPAATQRDEPKSKVGASIEELVRIASEKYQLNQDFWGKYTDIPSMAQAFEKQDILQIIDNFVLIHRKHVYLFQRLKNTVLKNLDLWSAPDLAMLCHSWVQLGFLHEDLCVAMSKRVTATAHTCNAQELCWLMDAYASARCTVQSAIEELTKQTLIRLEDFTPSQLCLHASSFARLNIQHSLLFDGIAKRLAALPPSLEPPPGLEDMAGVEERLSARDLTLAAYAFGKLGFHDSSVFEAISKSAISVIRDFTARDLQMLLVALARAQYRDDELLAALCLQADRRVAQFSSESLALTLRSLAFFNLRENQLFTRAIAQLPRAIQHSKPADVTTLLNAYATVQIHSVALIDVVTPFIMEKATFFTPVDWLSALRGYSSLGCRDTTFLSALRLHLAASKLTWSQLCSAMVDCSRLSFSGLSSVLAEAATAKVAPDMPPPPADVAAQMYSALLLLGHTTSPDSTPSPVRQLLGELSSQLRQREAAGELSPAACATLCYAILLAPPVVQTLARSSSCTARHPFDAAALSQRCVAEANVLSEDDRLVLRLVCSALKRLPWNRRALETVRLLEPLTISSTALSLQGGPVTPYLLSVLAHLTPHISLSVWHAKDTKPPTSQMSPPSTGCFQGIFVAKEMQEGLEDISAALAAEEIPHELVLDMETEAHISIPADAAGPAVTGRRQLKRGVALLWGSTVHYVDGASSEEETRAEPKLSPVSKLQVSVLKELRSVDVVVLPHWRWPRSKDAQPERIQTLANFVWDPANC